MKANFNDKDFLSAVKQAALGDEINTDDSTLVVEYIFDKPTHFPFQQKIFDPGVILKKKGQSNVRIHVPAESIEMEIVTKDKRLFIDKQKDAQGKVLPADRGYLRNPEKAEKLAKAEAEAKSQSK